MWQMGISTVFQCPLSDSLSLSGHWKTVEIPTKMVEIPLTVPLHSLNGKCLLLGLCRDCERV